MSPEAAPPQDSSVKGMWQGETISKWEPDVELPSDDTAFSILLRGAMQAIEALRNHPHITQINSDVNTFINQASRANRKAKGDTPLPTLSTNLKDAILNKIDTFHNAASTLQASQEHLRMFNILKDLVDKLITLTATVGNVKIALRDIIARLHSKLRMEFRMDEVLSERSDGVLNIGIRDRYPGEGRKRRRLAPPSAVEPSQS